MTELKPCPFCGRPPERKVERDPDGHTIIADIFCKRCHMTKRLVYSPGIVNKPIDPFATGSRLAAKEWNRRADNG